MDNLESIASFKTVFSRVCIKKKNLTNLIHKIIYKLYL